MPQAEEASWLQELQLDWAAMAQTMGPQVPALRQAAAAQPASLLGSKELLSDQQVP